jgi:micrococcal nuclease
MNAARKQKPLPARVGIAVFVLLAFLLGYFLRSPIPQIKVEPQQDSTPAASKNDFKQGTYRVTRVLDGDTIELQGGTRVRYAGVDAPENDETYNLSSTKLNQELVGGKDVLVVPTQERWDQYGRLLAYVYVGDVLVNEKMIEEGYARLFLYKGQKPEKYDRLKAAEDFARGRHLGIWLDEWISEEE